MQGDGETGGGESAAGRAGLVRLPGLRPVSVITGRSPRKGLAIIAAGRMGLRAQDQKPPYRYVSVEGPSRWRNSTPPSAWPWPAATWAPRAPTAHVSAPVPRTVKSVMFRMTREHWLSVDYRKQTG